MSMNRFLGIQTAISYREVLVSILGAVLSIMAIGWLSFSVTGYTGALWILPSMGATAVLLFAVPHGALSQPWALFGGHLFSAAIGVSCAHGISDPLVASGLAVGLSIGCMQMLRCVHPPGGATALVAVIGGNTIQDLGYLYLVVPTMLNCVIIFISALLFNNMFTWRKYPSSLMHYQNSKTQSQQTITVEHIQQAMDSIDEVVDIEAEQIKFIVDRADEIRRKIRR